jgi:hypothetical protein
LSLSVLIMFGLIRGKLPKKGDQDWFFIGCSLIIS